MNDRSGDLKSCKYWLKENQWIINEYRKQRESECNKWFLKNLNQESELSSINMMNNKWKNRNASKYWDEINKRIITEIQLAFNLKYKKNNVSFPLNLPSNAIIIYTNLQ